MKEELLEELGWWNSIRYYRSLGLHKDRGTLKNVYRREKALEEELHYGPEQKFIVQGVEHIIYTPNGVDKPIKKNPARLNSKSKRYVKRIKKTQKSILWPRKERSRSRQAQREKSYHSPSFRELESIQQYLLPGVEVTALVE